MNDKDKAEDEVQNVFIRCWEKREEIEISTSAKSYLYGAVRNASLNVLKHEKVKREHIQETKNQAQEEYSENTLEVKELEQKIENAISSLPDKCREVFLLSRREELKYKEIAETLSISIKTVENHMGKALKLLRNYLGALILFLPFANIFIKIGLGIGVSLITIVII